MHFLIIIFLLLIVLKVADLRPLTWGQVFTPLGVIIVIIIGWAALATIFWTGMALYLGMN